MNPLTLNVAALKGPGSTQTPALTGRLMPRSALSVRLEHAMLGLLRSHFTGVARPVFEADLADKNFVILLEDEDEVLRGFSTLRVYHTTAPGRPVTIVYSGDTIVERDCWGSHALARTWIQTVRQVAPCDHGDVYWLLLTSGYRTYRFLPVFFRAFYPRYDEATPSIVQSLLDAVARERFGARYDPTAGIVRFEHPQVLADDLLVVPTSREDAHIDFFLARNPGYVSGDEMVCLTRVHDDNLTAAGRRMAGIARGLKTCG